MMSAYPLSDFWQSSNCSCRWGNSCFSISSPTQHDTTPGVSWALCIIFCHDLSILLNLLVWHILFVKDVNFEMIRWSLFTINNYVKFYEVFLFQIMTLWKVFVELQWNPSNPPTVIKTVNNNWEKKQRANKLKQDGNSRRDMHRPKNTIWVK